MQPIQSIGGVLPIVPLSVLMAEAERRDQAQQANNQPVIQGLAAHVRAKWDEAKREKEHSAEPRMLKALRQKRSEYEPDVLSELNRQGSSKIYMGISSVKARAAASWLRDVLMGQRNEKPWLVSPTPVPELSPEDMQSAQHAAFSEAMQIEMQGGVVTPDILRGIMQRQRDRMDQKVMETARVKADRMNTKMEDQLLEGGYHKAFSDFVDDVTIFPSAVMKGPVVRNLKKLKWGQDGQMAVEQTLTLQWERIDPLMLYPERGAADVNDGYLFERHKLSRSTLLSLIGVDGYNEGAIREVLSENDRGGLQEWLNVDTARKPEGTTSAFHTPSTIEALQFWGSVPGSMLRDWGLDESEVPEKTEEYNVEVWLIGRWVIKAMVNPDPLGRKPYYKASYEQIPGEFWGHSVMDLTRDVQNMANAAARSLANNMGISSGPQVWVNLDRLPAGEDVTQLYPWKIWQTRSDPMGSATTAPPIDFFAPPSNAQELIGVFEHFSKLADEYSGIPRYMTGDHNVGGAARTASGMSMLMGNAGKAMKQVVSNIDDNVLQPMLERLYDHNMRYSEDPELKGDVQIIARGANALIVKEQAQVRRNEFLQIALASPQIFELVGMTGLAELLRPIATDLDIDTDKLIPPAPVVAQREQQKAMMQMLAMQAGAAQAGIGGPPQQQARAPQRPGSGQRLTDGNQATDNFEPPRRKS